jgi:hypothetical protein
MSEVKDFCIKECPIGKKKSREFLDMDNSAYDAALDMYFFVEKCMNTCPYKDKFNAKET